MHHTHNLGFNTHKAVPMGLTNFAFIIATKRSTGLVLKLSIIWSPGDAEINSAWRLWLIRDPAVFVILNLFQNLLNNGLKGYPGVADLRLHDGSGFITTNIQHLAYNTSY